MLTHACKPKNFGSDGFKGKNAVRQSRLGDRAGHSPDCAGMAILSDNGAVVRANETAAREPVGAHSGKHHGQSVGSIDADGAAEENIHGGTAKVFRSVVRESDYWLPQRGCRGYLKMPAAGRDISDSALQLFTGFGFAHPQLTTGVEAFGEQPGEEFRHVLNDENGERKSSGKSGEQNIESCGTACGCADQQHRRRCLRGLRDGRLMSYRTSYSVMSCHMMSYQDLGRSGDGRLSERDNLWHQIMDEGLNGGFSRGLSRKAWLRSRSAPGEGEKLR